MADPYPYACKLGGRNRKKKKEEGEGGGGKALGKNVRGAGLIAGSRS